MSCSCQKDGGQNLLFESGVDVSMLQPVLEQYRDVDGNLITILQKAQELYGYLPADLLVYIARQTGHKPAKILGVATFYAQFRLEPVGKHVISLCQGTACHVNGSSAIEKALLDELSLKESGTTEDGLFTFQNVACLGCCSLSPVMMINDETYGSLTPDKARKVIQAIRKEESV